MSDNIFGWTPSPDALASVGGCDGAVAELKSRRMLVNNRMLARGVKDTGPYLAEMNRLAALIGEIKVVREQLFQLADARNDKFGKAFRRAVRERFGEVAYRELVDQANRLVEGYDAQPSTAAHGMPALDPNGSSGGMRQRT